MIHESKSNIDSSWTAFLKYGISIVLSLLTRFSINIEVQERTIEEVIAPGNKMSITGAVTMFGKHFSILPDFIYKNKSHALVWLRNRFFRLAAVQAVSMTILIV